MSSIWTISSNGGGGSVSITAWGGCSVFMVANCAIFTPITPDPGGD